MTGREGTRRRGRGGHAREGRGGAGLPEPLPPLVNPLPPLELIGQDQLMRIVDAAYRVLEEAGLEILSDRCLDIYAANGCKVDRETRMVRIDRDTVQHFVALAPEQ
jgi:trimethylamine--corrinoid protein Co-methyltransferase